MIYVNEEKIDLNHFNDKSFYLKLATNNIDDEPIITWLFENNDEALALMFITRHLQEAGAHPILNMPYCSNSRQDRIESNSDIFTLKYFAEFINNLNFKAVLIYDPHSDVTPALINRCRIDTPYFDVHSLLLKHKGAIVVYPDSGSTKKYGPKLAVPYMRGIKVRNFETHAIESFQLVGTEESVKERDILIVDDICGTGHTLYKAARALKTMGANDIYIYVSHCENAVLGPHINGQSLLDIPNLITKLYTTNSIFTGTHPKVEILYNFI